MNDCVIFDLDGTLFQTETILVPALHSTFDYLEGLGEWEGGAPVEEYLSILGAPLPEVWRRLLPGASAATRVQADRVFLQRLIYEVRTGKGRLFSGVERTLSILSERGCKLFIASNGLEDYVREICRALQIEQYFTDLYSLGRFPCQSKTELVRLLMDDYHIETAVLAGDRRSDLEAAKANGCLFIGCCFGYSEEGELADADRIIFKFDDLLPLVENTFQK